jgi:hypothetical protein
MKPPRMARKKRKEPPQDNGEDILNHWPSLQDILATIPEIDLTHPDWNFKLEEVLNDVSFKLEELGLGDYEALVEEIVLEPLFQNRKAGFLGQSPKYKPVTTHPRKPKDSA